MNARENPFRTDRVHRVRYRLRDESLEGLVDRFRSLSYRGAIVGPNGAGKTTLLEDLESGLSTRGFEVKRLRLDDSTPGFSRGFLKGFFDDLTSSDVIFFDGADQMSRLGWLCFKLRSRKAGGLIITSHRRGLLPTLIECATSPELLGEIIAELLGAENPPNSEALAALYSRHNGNLRGALREMYDLYSVDKYAEAFWGA